MKNEQVEPSSEGVFDRLSKVNIHGIAGDQRCPIFSMPMLFLYTVDDLFLDGLGGKNGASPTRFFVLLCGCKMYNREDVSSATLTCPLSLLC